MSPGQEPHKDKSTGKFDECQRATSGPSWQGLSLRLPSGRVGESASRVDLPYCFDVGVTDRMHAAYSGFRNEIGKGGISVGVIR